MNKKHDWRTHPGNGFFALTNHARKGETAVESISKRVIWQNVDLAKEPGGARERQLRAGEIFELLEIRGGFSFGLRSSDHYPGWLPSAALAHIAEGKAHRVHSRMTHAYSECSIKSPENILLPQWSRVMVRSWGEDLAETDFGFIPTSHLHPESQTTYPLSNISELAKGLVGVPYLWGGDSSLGIDCSGYVAQLYAMCGVTIPGDSDLQEASPLFISAPVEQAQPGDLWFWRGHVAMVLNAQDIIHANAHSMSVSVENKEKALKRIEAEGGGALTASRRLAPETI